MFESEPIFHLEKREDANGCLGNDSRSLGKAKDLVQEREITNTCLGNDVQ